MGIGPLCRLFGKTRHAYYDRLWHYKSCDQEEQLALEMVREVRRELPGLGGHKLHRYLYVPFKSNGVKIGRDKLYTLLAKNNLLNDRKKKGPKTTQSNHLLNRYPNLIKSLEPVKE